MKLSDKIEKKIENLIDKKIKKNLSNPEKLGRVKRLESGTKDYLKILKKNFPKEFNLRGLRIVIDCANGAGYKAGPELLRSLGAKVIAIGVNPNGLNINKNCGSTFPNKIKFAVKKNKAHLGISLDGDADRIIMCDEKGNIIDGDQIIAALATRWKNKKMLKGGVVGTLMSNYGLEKFFKSEKIKFIRANVGDRYVKEKMQKNNFNLGGEQSGHIILGKFATTGDGLLVALEVLFAIRKGKKASDFFNKFQKTPQILKNIAVKDKEIINNIEVKKSIKIAEKLMKGQGRILVRKSGTESKIRVMGESENKKLLNKCINIISKKLNKLKPKSKILIIAGSDSSGGAGIQADIKTVTALGSYAMTAITAVTSQNTTGVKSIVPIDPKEILNQILFTSKDIKPDAIKIGMLHSTKVIESVIKSLEIINIKKIVLDPVMVAKGGAKLIDDKAINLLKTKLIKKVTLITPNIPEAEILTKTVIRNKEDMIYAANKLIEYGSKNVLIKGGHLKSKLVQDIFVNKSDIKIFNSQRYKTRNTHGTGCTLSSAITTFLSCGKPLKKSCELGIKYVSSAIKQTQTMVKVMVQLITSIQ